MSVVDVDHDPAERAEALEPQAAAELVQELALVSRSLFAQLLPDTPMRAIAGVTPMTGFAATHPAAPDGPAARSSPSPSLKRHPNTAWPFRQ